MRKNAEILIVEDNSGIARILASSLNENGYNTGIASTGQQAIAMMSEKHWDALVLDYSLPDMDGKQLIAQLGQNQREIPPFIVSTGRGDEQLAVDMMKLGAYDYLIKDPALLKRLPEVMERMLNDNRLEKELKQAHADLKASEERFRSLVENSGDIYLQLDSKGRYVYVSPNVFKLLGYAQQDFYGQDFTHFVHQEDLPATLSVLYDMLRKRSTDTFIQYRIRHKDGTIRYHSLTAKAIYSDTEPFFNCIARDVTSSYIEERRLAQTILETEEKQKVLLADLLHEDLGPLMAAVKLYMGKIKALDSNKEQDFEIINYMDSLVDETVGKVREIARQLKPGILFDFGLERALKSLLDQKTLYYGIQADLQMKEKMDEYSEISRIIMYRMIHLLLDNSVSIPSVSKVLVSIGKSDESVELTYGDNRKDYNPEDFLPHTSRNQPFLNLCARIHTIGGVVECSRIGALGHKVRVVLPAAL
ncbi:MAG: response regulator [Bacteroidales bacterium]